MKGRWIRLDTTWSSSAWVCELPPESRLAWVELLCYVKAHGIGGTAKALPLPKFAAVTGVTRDAVVAMIEAAKGDDALREEDGQWVLTGWDTYQSDTTSAERSRRYRQRQKEDTPPVTDRPVTTVTRDATGGTPTVTVTGTETRTERDSAVPAAPSKKGRKKPSTTLPESWEPTTEHRKRASASGLNLDREVAKFRNHAIATDRRQVEWNSAFTNWLMGTEERMGGRANGTTTSGGQSDFLAHMEKAIAARGGLT